MVLDINDDINNKCLAQIEIVENLLNRDILKHFSLF